MFNLKGKVAIVTGGNGGIGLAIASGLAEAGAVIAIIGRDAGKNSAACERLTAAGETAISFVADVTNEASVESAIDEISTAFGKIDILVNNAGSNDRKLPQDYTLAEWNTLLSANLTSAFIVSQAVYPAMSRSKSGKIINIGSMLSIFGNARAAPYAAAKGGIVQLTKSLAQAWAPDGINVNALLPGWIETELTKVARKQLPNLDEQVKIRTPQGRWGRPEDLAGAAVFLASRASDFVTGITLPVDGGYSSNT